MRFDLSLLLGGMIGATMLVGTAFAADTVGDRFSAIDKDKDTRMSWDEFSAVNPNISRKGFDTMDLNQDEKLSMEEWRTFYENHGMSVPGQSSSGMMPAQPATAPQVTAPAKPDTSAPAVPSDPNAAKPLDIKAGKTPDKPAAPRVGGMPLLPPPQSVKGPSSPTVRAPSVPPVSSPTVPSVGMVKPNAPTGKASNNIPLLSPPKIYDKAQGASKAEGSK